MRGDRQNAVNTLGKSCRALCAGLQSSGGNSPVTVIKPDGSREIITKIRIFEDIQAAQIVSRQINARIRKGVSHGKEN